MTGTRTQTKATSRADLLLANVEIVTLRLLDNPAQALERAIRPALEKRYLSRIDFRGFDADGLCHAQLGLEIDWGEHERGLLVHGTVRVNGHWVDKFAPEVNVLLKLFEDAVEQGQLTVRATAYPAPGVDPERVRQELRLNRAPPVRWGHRPSHLGYQVKQLEELYICLELADVGA